MGGTAPLVVAALGTAAATKIASDKMSTKSSASGNEDYQRRMAELDRKQKFDEDTRNAQLARTSASYRARLAAQGIDTSDGSAQAVLDGLKSKSTEELNLLNASYDDKRYAAARSFASVQNEGLKKNTQSSDLLKDNDETVRVLREWA